MRAPPRVLALLLLCFAACDEARIREVAPQIDVIATHRADDGTLLLDFGPVPVLNERALALTIDNVGQAPLRLVELTLTGAEEAFTFDAKLLDAPLDPAGTRSLPVRFKPPAQERYEGTLTLRHDDPTREPVTIRVVGSGSTVGRIEVAPAALDFGRVGEQTEAVVGLTIRSIGSAPLIVETIELVEADDAFSFVGSTRTPATLAAEAGEVIVPLRCAPTPATQGDSIAGRLRIVSTDPERRELFVPLTATLNRAPTAVIEPVRGVFAPGDALLLDGSGSSDADGDEPLSFSWRVYRRPFESAAAFVDPGEETPTLVLDAPGEYELGLDVEDAAGLSCLHPEGDPRRPCARTSVLVQSADALRFELVWDHPVADLDLHVVEAGRALYSSQDCYFGNPTPDFGVFGNSLDDPRLTRDDLSGFGPETIVYSEPPEGGSYEVSAVYYAAQGSAQTNVRATLRVYVYGVLEAELSRELPGPGLLWKALTLGWPASRIEVVDETAEAPSP